MLKFKVKVNFHLIMQMIYALLLAPLGINLGYVGSQKKEWRENIREKIARKN